ncbi:MAG TPA: protoporphyrinogen oxidase [Bryobacteraceae bacterium]|nr:protoporphyrinogen oxidase [Bryobacteraceae bacterium]
MRRAVIIGGGISGLSTAYYLAKAGIEPTLIEARSHLGGVIRTDTLEGCVIEAGPDSFLSAKPWAMDLICELGLADEVIGSNDHLRVTYVVKHGRLVPLPDGLMMMVPTKVMPIIASGLLSWPTKLRMGLEFFRRPPAERPRDRSVSEFIEDHYGREAVEYLAEPLLAGVYGGDPNRLSVSSVLPRFAELEYEYGSLTRGVLDQRRKRKRSDASGPLFRTLKRGLGHLIETLTGAIGSRMEVIQGHADAMEKTPAGFRIRVNGAWLEASHVVLACQAYAAAPLAGMLDPELGRCLESIPYSSSMTLALGYRRQSFGQSLKGFGFLVPRKERRTLVACTWVGNKFAHRIPEEWVVLRCFVGGLDDSFLRESDETITAAVRAELSGIMGVTAAPELVRISRWPRSMAQYTVGHESRLKEIEQRTARIEGLSLAGNAYYGIGVPDCIRLGKQAAGRITSASES